MSGLVPLPEPDRAAGYAWTALAPATLAATAADWADFSAWCGAQGVASLPAAPVTVAGYLAALSSTHAGATLRRRVAGIGTAEIRKLVATCDASLVGKRDRALLLLLGFRAAYDEAIDYRPRLSPAETAPRPAGTTVASTATKQSVSSNRAAPHPTPPHPTPPGSAGAAQEREQLRIA